MCLMLTLHGTANFCHGISASRGKSVLRLRSPSHLAANTVADFALLRSTEQLESAVNSNFTGAVIISDEPLDPIGRRYSVPQLIGLPTRFNYLADGDIIGIDPQSRRFRTLYRQSSAHNSFLVTERCNHYCLMCSQPPRNVDDRWILDEIKACLPLVDKATHSLGFTGGEPLLDWREFIAVLTECRTELPETAIHVLSNGRAFARDEVVAAWAAIRHPKLTVGIPIYAAVDHIHDHVVQARGAFDETVLGVLKLKDKGQRVEIRVVLHALTAPRIVETCKWFARNLPFVDHVALMGLENTGFAIANSDALWMDPIDFRDDLALATEILASAKVNVSIYNLPRCVLARSVWSYAAQSISDWKNDYVEECHKCIEKPRCSGFFTTGRPRYSRAIRAIQFGETLISDGTRQAS
jgi:His-Xaa-Ser system radical SAM maturase HxsC